jgi:hypothetical protein
VWDACVQAANSQFTLEHSEKASHALSFKSGTSATSWGFDVGVSLVKISDKKTRVILNPQKRRLQLAWGAGGRIADKYFDAVQKSLAELASQPPEGDSRK